MFCLVFRKMAFYLLTKLYIFEPCSNVASFRRLDLGFDKFRGKPNMGRNFLESFKVSLAFPEKWFYIRWPNLVSQSHVPIFSHSEDSM